MEKVGHRWFWGSGVERVEIPASVREIGPSAFRGCESLERITFLGTTSQCRSQLKTISAEAFRDCVSLKNIALPEGLEEIGFCAFDGSGLESIATPLSVRMIHQGAFSGCKCLRMAVLNEGLEVLGTDEDPSREGYWCGVFKLSALESVTLPSTLRKIGRGTFSYCNKLRRISLPEGLERIGPECFLDSGLEEIWLPSSVRAVGAMAFKFCKELRRVQFSDGLEMIGAGAFAKSGIASVVLPSSVKTIGGHAFAKC